MKKKILVILCIITLAATLVTVLGAGYLMTSTNHISGTPTAKATLTLATNNTAPLVGDTLTLTAHVSDNTLGIPITLKNNNNVVGVPINTDSSGNAVFQVVVTTAYDFIAEGTHP
jgi:flagellar basal body-associated protein FliL